MKKLIIVGTKPSSGKGGISLALTGYLNGLDAKNITYLFIESHAGGQNKLLSWLYAFGQIVKLSIQYRQQAVFWFHCGPWFSSFRKFSLAIIPFFFRCMTIAHIHSPTFNDYLTTSHFSKFLLKIFLFPFKQLIVLTPWWKNLLIAHGVTNKILVSANPNSDEYCQIAKNFLNQPKIINEQKKQYTILTMARLVKGKGVDVVIKSFALLPKNYNLIIAGDGALQNALMALATHLNVIDRITFTGWIDGEQKKTLFFKADLFCLPSTYDSFGMVFIEAMAFDLPVVAYGWGPIADVVTSDVGVCCSESSVKQVHKAIVDICANLSRFSSHGPKIVLEKYTADIASNNIISFLT